jgi:methyl-accepting chemotaxis protein
LLDYYELWGFHMRKRTSFIKIPTFDNKRLFKPKMGFAAFLKKIKFPRLNFKNKNVSAGMQKPFKFKKPSFNLKDLKSIKFTKFFTGIRGRIILLALFTLLCMVFPIFTSINTLDKNIKKNLKELNISTNQGIAEKVDNQVRRNLESLDLLPKSADILAMDKFQQERALRKLAEGRFNTIYFTDGTGAMTFTTDPNQIGVSAADMTWYTEAMKGNSYISNATVDEVTRQPFIYVSTPVLDQNQKPAAVIGAKMDLNYMQQLVKEAKIGEHGIAYIVDKNGIVLAHRDFKEKVLSVYNAAENKIKGAQNIVDGISGATIYTDDKGNEVYGVFTQIPSSGWGLITELPVSEALQPVKEATDKITWMAIFAFILAVIGSLVLAFMITKPLKDMAKVASLVKSGDLRERIKVTAKDEIGDLQIAFNQMTDSLSVVLREVGVAVEEVTDMSYKLSDGVQISSAATQQISAIVESVAEGAQSQIKSVNTTADITREITEGVVVTANKTQTVAKAATDAALIAKEGSENINIINEKIIGIKNNVVSSAKLVEKLGNKSAEVTGMVKVIRDIAGKTNMLALNAAIEAARAGEAGKGFAVVANEIRNLAEQTREASKNIETLLIEIKKETDYTVTSMNQGLIEVEAGTVAISATYSTFNKIIEEIHIVAGDINTVSESVLELKGETDRILNSIDEINEIAETTSLGTQSVLAGTEEQASSMQEINSLASGLSDMAITLKNIILKFKI